MPNTKSAERRVRNSAKKHLANHSVKSELRTLERGYLETISAGNKDQALASYRTVSSALDKAAKTGVIHRATANRKKSRLAIRLKQGKPVEKPAEAEPAA